MTYPRIRLAGVADPSTYRPATGTIPESPGVYRFRGHPSPASGSAASSTSARRRTCAAGSTPTSPTVDAARAHPADGHHGGQRRLGHGRHRGRGAPAGVRLDQGVRPAVQRPLPRRQVLPVPGGHARRGVPAAAGDARRQAQGRALLRAVLARLGHPRDARPAAAGVPGAHLLVRRLQAVTARSAGRACSATSASARRRASAGSTPPSTGRSSRTSATSWPARPTR